MAIEHREAHLQAHGTQAGRRPETEASVEIGGFRWAAQQRRDEGMFPGLVRHEFGRGEFRGLEFFEVEARSIITDVPAAAQVPFRHTINAYRGCSHACSYCFARPTHEYLNLGSGDDFDRKLVVKVNAVERLRAELKPKRWAGDHIAMGTNTDPYQRAEGKYRLTQGVVSVLAEHRNPFSVLTKSTLILRDLDLLAEAASRTEVVANFSIGTVDDEVWKLTEPGTPRPFQRVEAVARLNEAGVRCGVLVAPILPGLSDSEAQIDAVVGACVEAGAASISAITLHLRPGVRQHFLAWLQAHRPDLVGRYREMYGRRSYAPKRYQAKIAARVARAIERHGGLATRPGGAPRMAPAAAPDPAPSSQQLGFDLRV